MKTLRFAAAVALLLPACGCVPLQSFYPLWDAEHAAYEPCLVGEWRASDPDETDILTIEESEGPGYLVTYTEKADNSKTAKQSRFQAHLVRLGEHLFLDFTGDEPSFEERLKDETYQPVILMHFFARIDLDGNTLKLAVLDDERFEKKIAKEEAHVPLLKRGDTLLLTAETGKIQQVLRRFAEDDELWGDADDECTFVRAPASDAR